MHDYVMAKDNELWDTVLDEPYIPMNEVKDSDVTKLVPKTQREYNETNKKKVVKYCSAKKLLVYGIRPDEYNRISSCESVIEIWDCSRTTHEGTTQVKESKVGMLTTQYENFTMKKSESIHKIHTRFTSITNKLRC